MKIRTLAVALAALTVVSCGKSAEQKAAEQTAEASKQAAEASKQAAQSAQQGTQSLAQGLQQLAQGLQQTGADGKPVPPIDFEKLEALEPDAPSGWEKGKSKGQQVSMGVSVSTAEVTYTKGDAHVKLTITDAAFNQLFMAPFSMMMAMGYSERTSDGYKKATTINGNPGWEEWNNSKHGELGVVVGKRFVVQGEGSELSSVEDVRAIVQAVDFSKLAALK
jgi:hypothetical protein